LTLLLEMPFVWDNEKVFFILFYLQLIVLCYWMYLDSEKQPRRSVLVFFIMIVLICGQLWVIWGPRFQFIQFTILTMSPFVTTRREVVRGLDSKQSSPYDGNLRVMHEWEHEIVRESTRHDDCMTATPTQAPRTPFVDPHYITPPPNHADTVVLGAPYDHNQREEAIMLEVFS